MRSQFTKKFVALVEAKSKPYELRDTHTKGLILRIQPSGHKSWIVSWAHGKRRTLGSVSELTLDQARAHATKAMSEAAQQRLPSLAATKPQSCSLREFLTEHYSPWAATELKGGEKYVQRIRRQFQGLLDLPITDLHAPSINRWWRDRVVVAESGRTVERATAHRDFAALRAALSMAVEWKLLEKNPLLGIRHKSVQSKSIVRFLSESEETALRSALKSRDRAGIDARANANASRRRYGQEALQDLPPTGFLDHLTPLVLVAINTGMRKGELLSLSWSDVNWESRMITVRAENAKSGRQRHIPMNDEALNTLQRWSEQREGAGLVFGLRDAKKGWSNLLSAAGVENFRFHDLRHHFASRLVSAGVDLNTVRELLGHSDIKMTLRYAHLCPSTLAAAVARL